MKRKDITFSKNNKKSAFKKRYEPDKKFMKLYMGRDNSQNGCEIKELFQDGDFGDQLDADHAYDTNEVMPYIFYIFSDVEYKTNKNGKVKKIVIKFCGKNHKVFKLPHRAFDLFQNQIWVETDFGDPWSSDKSYYECRLEELKFRKREGRALDIYHKHFSPSNIWNEYCMIEGRTTISRDDFSRWLYRLSCLVFDLLEYSYLTAANWQTRLKVIKGFIQDKYSQEYEYFDVDRWATALKDAGFDQNTAYDYRLEDARRLLNDFFSHVKIESALEDFLKDCYAGFADELRNRKLLIKCGYCNSFIAFVKNKKYCSLLHEGKDCGKKARNKKYYSTRGKSRLLIYRRKTNELRKYYKEKGIKK